MSANNPASDASDPKLYLERVLRAARPALAKELTSILAEYRTTIEQQANENLQKATQQASADLKKALLEKESELQKRTEEACERVAAETREKVRGEITAELEARFKEALAAETKKTAEKHSDELAAVKKQMVEIQAASVRLNRERVGMEAEIERWRRLAEGQQAVRDAESQSGILREYLRTAMKFADGAAIYLNKDDGLSLWQAEGESGIFPDVVSKNTIDPDWYFSTLVVRDKMIAAAAAARPKDAEALAVLTGALQGAIELHGYRTSSPEPKPEVVQADETPRPNPGPAVQAPEADPSPAPSSPNSMVDARALAHTIVSELKAGHEKQVLEGRVNHDLYTRLKDPIENARAAYLRQLGEEPDTDYFHQELVHLLADHALSRLGKDYPGPRNGS